MRTQWTEEEEELLVEHYVDSSPEELLFLFPNRTLQSIKAKSWKLGIRKTNPEHWTEEEVWLIKEGYPAENVTNEDLLDMIPNRSWTAIKVKADTLNLKRPTTITNKKKWTEEEKDLVREAYCDPERGRQWLAKKLNRTPKSISHQAQRMNVKLKPHYSEEEVQYVLDNFDKDRLESILEIAKYLGRSERSVAAKASELGIRNNYDWTEEHIQYLKDNYETKGAAALEKYFGRAQSAIVNKAGQLGLVVDRKEKFRLEAIQKLKDTDYEIIEYKKLPGNDQKSLIKHKTCGHEWWVKLGALDSYAGCPNCSKGNWNRRIFYLLFFPVLNLYKVGITMDLTKRLRQYNYTPELIDSRVFKTPEECANYESDLKKKLKPYMADTGLLHSGNTETFYWPDASDIKNSS